MGNIINQILCANFDIYEEKSFSFGVISKVVVLFKYLPQMNLSPWNHLNTSRI
jgi:hypothetical protein